MTDLDRTRIPTTVLEDPNLSAKAKGILAHLLSKGPDLSVNVTQLVGEHDCGKSAYRSGLNELIEEGYILRERERSDDGTYAEIQYHLSDNLFNDKNE